MVSTLVYAFRLIGGSPPASALCFCGGYDAGLPAVQDAGRHVFFYGEFAGTAFGYAGSRHIDVLREAVRETKRERPFHIDAWMVLPDHMRCVWTLPPSG